MVPGRIYVGQIVVSIAIVIIATWSATQWTASALSHQVALGEASFSVGGYLIYSPWRVFEWWLFYEAYAPNVFLWSGVLIASGGIVGALFSLLNSLWRARQNQQATTYGSARWATTAEIDAAGLFRLRGVVLGQLGGRYLRHDGSEHVMCFAPTRSGKGVGLVLPTLLSWTSSAVVHDVKGENWQFTSGWRALFSNCVLFDPTNMNSARYNPLLEIRKGHSEVRDAQNIADILVDPEGALERRNHWEKASHALLVGVILHVLYAEEEKTLARVTEILADPLRSFEKVLRIMMTTNHLGTNSVVKIHPVVAAVARELLNKSENERSGVLSTAVSMLGLYRDPAIARNTGACDWRIADLVTGDKPVTLYLVVPPSDIVRTKPLIRLILNQIGRRLTEMLGEVDGEVKQRPLLMMLDEFPALGRLDFFETGLAFMAGYGIRCFLIAQSLNQIAKSYGDNNSILDNCHVRVAFAANDERTAKRISDALGTATELRAQRNYAGHRLAPWLGHVMVSRQESARPLLTPGEVMQLPPDEEIVLVSGLAPVRAKKLRHYEDANFTSRLLPPPCLARSHYSGRSGRRSDDWSGMVQTTVLPSPERAFGYTKGRVEGCDGPLPVKRPEINRVRAPEERLFDDDADGRCREAPSLLRRAHAMTRDDDDLLPTF
jgi:type IV secretion system protein VirD4